ncbi:MAG TPA: hypothetical protein VIM73_11145 [Polyangiaceae bacterium]
METQRQPVIACALDGESMKGRVEQWAALGREALRQGRLHPSGVVLRYRRQDGVETELKRLVTLERDCCVFLKFTLVEEGEELVLTVTGPDAAVPIIRECWGF